MQLRLYALKDMLSGMVFSFATNISDNDLGITDFYKKLLEDGLNNLKNIDDKKMFASHIVNSKVVKIGFYDYEKASLVNDFEEIVACSSLVDLSILDGKEEKEDGRKEE